MTSMLIPGGRAWICDCPICTFSNEISAAELDRDRLAAAADGLIEQGVDIEMRLAYLIEAVERFSGRLDAPGYLRDALRIARGR